MKSSKILFVSAFLLAGLGSLTSCGGSPKITVWVGEESASFYQKKCDEFLADNADFGYKIEVKGQDTGSVAGVVTQDASAAADIYTVAHDNIGKLASNQCAKPISDESLINQILNDNPDSFKNVIYSTLNNNKYLYGAPYISQSLFLFYNKTLVTDEQAQTFEGLTEAAKEAGTKAWTVTGTDGYNNSFSILATNVKDHSTTVKIYENAAADGSSKGTSYIQGDDTIALVRYMQRSIKSDNGFKWASSDGWNADFKNKGVCAVIGGAWHYSAASAAIGETNLGMALIPTMTLTNEDCEDLTGVKAGDTFRGGTFADCKCFLINAKSDASKYSAEQKLIKYLISKDVQNESFKECSNLPSYKGSSEYIKTLYDKQEISENQYKLATSQIEMANWGIPQPFITGSLNTYYYSKNAPDVYKAIIDGSDYPSSGDKIVTSTNTLEGIRKGLYMMEYLWNKGMNPTKFPDTLPHQVSAK